MNIYKESLHRHDAAGFGKLMNTLEQHPEEVNGLITKLQHRIRVKVVELIQLKRLRKLLERNSSIKLMQDDHLDICDRIARLKMNIRLEIMALIRLKECRKIMEAAR